jgi:SAM-dependent methyltransferase
MSPQRRDWDEIARLDPLWAILSDPAKRHGGWDMEEFLATGQREIGAVLETAKRWDLPVRRQRALDFGCGVGRLTRAMSSEFAVARGVDISGEMISLALAINADVRACSFEILGDEGLTAHPDGYFDFIYSRIVLQHVPDRRATEASLTEFVRLLAPGGLLVFQLPSFIPLRRRLQVRPNLYALLRSMHVPETFLYQRLGLHPIRMRSIPEVDVVRLLTAAGATVLDIQRTEIGYTGIQDRTYWATRAPQTP